jgi:3-oxoacyl-(acyl-carrier-protein) synthase/thioesterase domain-containing protein
LTDTATNDTATDDTTGMDGTETASHPEGAVAIVGMAGRFPGAADVGELWALLNRGETAIRRFDREELRAAGVPDVLADDPGYVPFGTVMDGADLFDAAFFGITPAEAAMTDPQHRIFLECAWSALEDAGVVAADPGRTVGVFGGTSISTYLYNNILSHPERAAEGVLAYPVMIGNDKDFLCTRTAYRLGLSGPAVTVQTACSTSLVAVHLACQSLLEGECDTALAGGVSVFVPQEAGYPYSPGGPLSADGQCRVFDSEGTGTVKGNGCAVVVLRRLEDALTDRDHIYAVIRGTAVNNDGSAKVGFTAPSVAGQRAVIQDALAFAGVPAAEIGYVETHGTGTRLGDPIEIKALAEALSSDGRPPERCLIGSLKANIGHLDTAAGAAGLVKAALVLAHRTVPPQVGFDAPNPELKLETTPFEVPTSTRSEPSLRAAGVSSFGIGGTNAHAILGIAPERARPAPPAGPYVLVLSARDDNALRLAARKLHDHLAGNPETRLDDVAFTLASGRAHYAVRAGWVASDLGDLLTGLSQWPADEPARRSLPVLEAWLRGEDLQLSDCGDLTAAIKVPLPGYALNPQRHWVSRAEPAEPAASPAASGSSQPNAGPAPAPASQYSLAEVREAVLDVLGAELGLPDLAPDDDYFEVGGESLSALAIVAALRTRLGVTLTLPEFETAGTATRMARVLFGRLTGDQGRRGLTVRLKAGRTDRDIFLIHPAGGSAFAYHGLARHSTDPSPLHAITFPFDEPGDHTTVEGLAERYLAEIERVRPAGPYRLGGYSFGGNVAFEMAVRLRAAGEQVDHLVLLDSLPPEAYQGIDTDEAAFSAMAPGLLGEVLELEPTAARGTAPPTTIDEVVGHVRQANWTDATEDEVRSQLTVMHLNIRALAAHRPTRTFDGPTSILAAGGPRSPVFDALGVGPATALDWSARLTGPVRSVVVPGDHYSSIRAHAADLARAFDDVLSGTTGERGTTDDRGPVR